MPAGSKADQLAGIIEIRLAREIFAFEPAGSVIISLGAGLPARGEMVMRASPFYDTGHGLAFQISAAYWASVQSAGELAGAGDIQNRHPRPSVAVRVQFAEPLIRREIGSEVRQVHVMVPIPQQRIEQRGKDPGS
jgi:hypothetical protein